MPNNSSSRTEKKTNKQTKCILIKRRKPKGKFHDDSEWIGTNSVWGVFLPTNNSSLASYMLAWEHRQISSFWFIPLTAFTGYTHVVS